jgi:hypothetical protein
MIAAFFITLLGLLVAGVIGFLVGRNQSQEQPAPATSLVADCTSVEFHRGSDGTTITMYLTSPQSDLWDFMSLVPGTIAVRSAEEEA